MRIDDEFNQIEINNDQQIEKAEFGHVQKNEFSDEGDTSLGKSPRASKLNQTTPESATSSSAATISSRINFFE